MKKKANIFELPPKCPALATKITGIFGWRHTYQVHQRQKGIPHCNHYHLYKSYSLNLPRRVGGGGSSEETLGTSGSDVGDGGGGSSSRGSAGSSSTRGAPAAYRSTCDTNPDSWVVVHHLQSQSGILDPEDHISDVADDREEIIASYEDAAVGLDPGVQQGGGDGASGSSVGTGSPDIFQTSVTGVKATIVGGEPPPEVGGGTGAVVVVGSEGATSVEPVVSVGGSGAAPGGGASCIEVFANEPAPLGLGLQVRRGSEPSLHQIGVTEQRSPLYNVNPNGNHQGTSKRCEMLLVVNETGGPLGLTAIPDMERGGLLVQSVEPGSRAERGRLRRGDRILEINNIKLVGLSESSVQEHLKKSLASTELRLWVVRGGGTRGTGRLVKSGSGSRYHQHQHHQHQHQHQHQHPRDNRIGQMMIEAEEKPAAKVATVSPTRKVPGAPSTGTSLQVANTRKLGKRIEITLTKGDHGLGFSVTTRDNPAGGHCPIYIKNILPKGAAVEDGRLRPGDRLLEVEGIPMTGKSQTEVVSILRGTPHGATLKIVVSRQQELAVDVKEREIGFSAESEPKNSPPKPPPPVLPKSSLKQSSSSNSLSKSTDSMYGETGGVGNCRSLPKLASTTPVTSSPKTPTIQKKPLASILKSASTNHVAELLQQPGSATNGGSTVSSSTNNSGSGVGSESLAGAAWKNREILTLHIPVHDTEKAGLGVSVKGKTGSGNCSGGTNSSGNSRTDGDLGIFVKSVLHGGAASRDGRLKMNDQLLSVNGVSLLGQSNAEAMDTNVVLIEEDPEPTSPTFHLTRTLDGGNAGASGVALAGTGNTSTPNGTGDATYASQLSLETNSPPSDAFSRDAVGRRSMSEKHHAAMDARETGTYQRNKKLREKRDRDSKLLAVGNSTAGGGSLESLNLQQMGRINSLKHGGGGGGGGGKQGTATTTAALASHLLHAEAQDQLGDLGPSLGMKKSSSLESLQTMVQEIQMADEPRGRNALRTPRGRGREEILRAVVEQPTETQAKKHWLLEDGPPSIGGEYTDGGFITRNSPFQSSLNDGKGSKLRVKKSGGLLRGIGHMFRFGKHRKDVIAPSSTGATLIAGEPAIDYTGPAPPIAVHDTMDKPNATLAQKNVSTGGANTISKRTAANNQHAGAAAAAGAGAGAASRYILFDPNSVERSASSGVVYGHSQPPHYQPPPPPPPATGGATNPPAGTSIHHTDVFNHRYSHYVNYDELQQQISFNSASSARRTSGVFPPELLERDHQLLQLQQLWQLQQWQWLQQLHHLHEREQEQLVLLRRVEDSRRRRQNANESCLSASSFGSSTAAGGPVDVTNTSAGSGVGGAAASQHRKESSSSGVAGGGGGMLKSDEANGGEWHHHPGPVGGGGGSIRNMRGPFVTQVKIQNQPSYQ
uniref:PDZ domain-containing protein n=1 Tax=Anopheles farauti TaxID=69004 RepID=A0A182R114_9DIPT